MKQAISLVTLGVRDLARSRAFYKALGWRESSASEESIAFFQAGSTAFALFARDALAEDAGVPGSLSAPVCSAHAATRNARRSELYNQRFTTESGRRKK